MLKTKNSTNLWGTFGYFEKLRKFQKIAFFLWISKIPKNIGGVHESMFFLKILLRAIRKCQKQKNLRTYEVHLGMLKNWENFKKSPFFSKNQKFLKTSAESMKVYFSLRSCLELSENAKKLKIYEPMGDFWVCWKMEKISKNRLFSLNTKNS